MPRSRIEILTTERDRRIGEVDEYETTIAILLEALGVITSGSDQAPHIHDYKHAIEGLVDQNRVQLQKSQIMLQALERLLAKQTQH